MNVDGPLANDDVVPARRREQRVARHHPARAPRERHEEVELDAREIHGLALRLHDAPRNVDGDVAHAQHLRRALNALGVRAGVVHGEMDGALRAKTLKDFADGKIQALANVAVLTEGFDDPGVSCVAMAP